MARDAGHAPALLTRAPYKLVRTLICCMPKSQWRHLEPLLPTVLTENEQIAKLDASDASRFASITARVLLLGGAKSPAAITRPALQALQRAIPKRSCDYWMVNGTPPRKRGRRTRSPKP